MTVRTGPRALYIYYRVSPEQLAAGLLERVWALQAEARAACPGLHATLMARTDTDTDNDNGAQIGPDATWMEVYVHPDGVPTALEVHLARAMATWPANLTLARHTESFAPVMPPFPLD